MRRHGFSLVELSIVLVILGLLTGGILSGQSLIRASEMRSYTSDIARYRTAALSFRDKYFAIPGDMSNAISFWGSAGGDGTNAACQNTASTSQATCNGNGDGWVDTNTVTYDERFHFWQHLANAGLIEGAYSGRTDSSTSGSFILNRGLNVPAMKGNATTTIVTFTTTTGNGAGSSGTFMLAGFPAGNYLELRGLSGNSSQLLKPEEAWNIDTKLDDGRPGSGIVAGAQYSWNGVGCTTTDDPATSVYSLTNSAIICRLNIRLN